MTDDDREYLSDYDEQMDAVRLGLVEYDAVHCRHGTFVGDWAGPDYMCHWCESGVTDEEYLAAKRDAERRTQARTAARRRWAELQEIENDDERDAAMIAFLETEEGQWLVK